MLSGLAAGCAPWLRQLRVEQLGTGENAPHHWRCRRSSEGQGMQILATHLSDNAVDFRELITLARPVF